MKFGTDINDDEQWLRWRVSKNHCARALRNNWGEPERAPHDQSNGDRVCVCVCVCPSYVHIPYICAF